MNTSKSWYRHRRRWSKFMLVGNAKKKRDDIEVTGKLDVDS